MKDEMKPLKKQSPTNVRSAKVLAISHARVLELFSYDAAVGKLHWKIKPAKRIIPGSVAGQQKRDGYWYVGFDGVRLPAHHVVWFYHNGVWPEGYLAFKNGDLSDTTLENLEIRTASESQKRKAKPYYLKEGGIKGIKWDASRSHWRVRWCGVYVGGFVSLDEAKEALGTAKRGELADDYKVRRLKAKMVRVRLRAVWREVLDKGPTDWDDFESFVASVGDRPGPETYIRKLNSKASLGPNNFEWAKVTPEEKRARTLKWREDNRERTRNNWLKKQYGVEAGWAENQLAEQNGACAICKCPETHLRQGKLLPLAVDHDHSNGKARGLLCHSCNIGIGALRDNPEILREAALYIERYREEHKEKYPDNVIAIKDHRKPT